MKGPERKLILNTKTFEIHEGLKNLCDKQNLHLANMSNKLSGKINNNTEYLYVKRIFPEIKNPYFTKNNREFNFLEVFCYMDRYGGGDIAIVQMLDDKSKHVIRDEKISNYINIDDEF